jgi:hypothetical protein
LPGIQDQVHVVWHQAIGPHYYLRLARLLAKEIAVNLLIAVFKENRFSTIAALRHVVRETGYHHCGPNASCPQTYHERNPQFSRQTGLVVWENTTPLRFKDEFAFIKVPRPSGTCERAGFSCERSAVGKTWLQDAF